jgi:hypothetical protein
VNHIDEDGGQWRISFYQDAGGRTQITLVYNAAILNSSRNQQLKMKEIIKEQQRLFSEVFGQGNVTAIMNLREIQSHESIIQVLSPESFVNTGEGEIGFLVWAHLGGGRRQIKNEQETNNIFRDSNNR